MYRQYQAATATLECYQLAVLQAPAAEFVRVQADHGFFSVGEQARCGAGAAHAVPLVTQAAGVEAQGKTGIALFLRGAVGVGNKVRSPGQRWELSVGVQARTADAGTAGEWPLLWALRIQQRITQAAEVEVAVFGQVFVFVEQRLRAVEVKQAGLSGAQQGFQTAGEVTGDGPVWPRFGGCRHGLAHVGDTPFGVGYRAFFLAPTGGG